MGVCRGASDNGSEEIAGGARRCSRGRGLAAGGFLFGAAAGRDFELFELAGQADMERAFAAEAIEQLFGFDQRLRSRALATE